MIFGFRFIGIGQFLVSYCLQWLTVICSHMLFVLENQCFLHSGEYLHDFNSFINRDVTAFLRLLLRKEGFNFHSSSEMEIVRTIKEVKHQLFLCHNFDNKLQTVIFPSVHNDKKWNYHNSFTMYIIAIIYRILIKVLMSFYSFLAWCSRFFYFSVYVT